MPDDVGGQPFQDGEEPEYRHHGGADDEFASVVLDDDFVRSAVVHEPTAAERILAAAQSHPEPDTQRGQEDAYGRRKRTTDGYAPGDEPEEDDPDGLESLDGLDGPEDLEGPDEEGRFDRSDYDAYPDLGDDTEDVGPGDPYGYPHGYGSFGHGSSGFGGFGEYRGFGPGAPGMTGGTGSPYVPGRPSGRGRYTGFGRGGGTVPGPRADHEHGSGHGAGAGRGSRPGPGFRSGRSGSGRATAYGVPASGRGGRRFGARGVAPRLQRTPARWQRPVAWALAVIMGIGMVALALGAVYRSGAGQRQAPAPPSSTTGAGSPPVGTLPGSTDGATGADGVAGADRASSADGRDRTDSGTSHDLPSASVDFVTPVAPAPGDD